MSAGIYGVRVIINMYGVIYRNVKTHKKEKSMLDFYQFQKFNYIDFTSHIKSLL